MNQQACNIIRINIVLFLKAGLIFSIFSIMACTTPKTPLTLVAYDWNGNIPPKQIVIVKNNYGSIRSRSNIDKKIFLHATYQKIGNNPVTPKFDIKEINGKLIIEVLYSEAIKDKAGKLRGRTDISIVFPPTVSIVAESTNGFIKIDKTASHVIAKTVSGDIKLKTTGLFSATTDSGNISLKLRGIRTLGESTAYTRSGKLKVAIFSDMDLDLRAESDQLIKLNGKQVANKVLSIKQGKELSKVHLVSKTGGVFVDVVDPPELVQSVVPSSIEIDLRQLPKSNQWKPGDPVNDINEKLTHSKNKQK